jgi:hypothetical protein
MFNKRKGWLAIVLTLILVLFNGIELEVIKNEI